VCSQTGSVTVTVTPANVDITGAEYREICLGDTVTLNGQVQPAGTITWSPSFYVSSTTGASVTSSPDESVTIYATATLNGCLVRDSVRLRVDSLPNSAIFLDPEKPIYCPGDTIYLLSKTYEPADFPNIMPEWISGGGDITPLDLWNLVIYATTTKVFTRKVTNGGCSTKDSITVNVGTVPTIMITATPPQLCPGQTSQLLATVDPAGEKLEWKESMTLSDTKIPNPVASPTSTTTYTVSTPDADCPTEASIQVEVLATPILQLPNNPTVCPGGSIQLNNGPNEPGTTYSWTSVPAGFTSVLANPIVTPTATTTYKVTAQGPLCSAAAEVLVTVANGSLDAGPDQTICLGQSATLQATPTGTPGTVTWTPGNLTGNSVSVMPLNTTSYTATLLYGPNCLLQDSLRIFVAPSVSISSITGTPGPADSLCLGTPLTLKVTKTPATAVLTWFQNGEVIAGATTDSIKITSAGETVTFTAMAALGNCTATAAGLEYNFRRCFDMPNAFTPNGD
ncbi:MAG: hypothetical protein ABIO24_07825, partial [Saprospiraceae bacterium]